MPILSVRHSLNVSLLYLSQFSKDSWSFSLYSHVLLTTGYIRKCWHRDYITSTCQCNTVLIKKEKRTRCFLLLSRLMLSRLSEWRVSNKWRYLFLFSISHLICQEIYWLSCQNSSRTWLLLTNFTASSLAQDIYLLAKILLITSWASFMHCLLIVSQVWTIDLSFKNRKQLVSILRLACHAGQIPNPFCGSWNCELLTTISSPSSFLISSSTSVPFIYSTPTTQPSFTSPPQSSFTSGASIRRAPSIGLQPAVPGSRNAVHSLLAMPAPHLLFSSLKHPAVGVYLEYSI